MPFFVPVALGLMSLVGTPSDPPAAPSGREVQLIGFGLVVGLDGTGGRSTFTRQVVEDMTVRMFGSAPGRMRKIADRQLHDRLGPCRRLHEGAEEKILRPMSCSAVLVLAVLPAATEKGEKVHLTVSPVDDATSLRGGVLLLTPLKGADGQVYAAAQGALSVRPTDDPARTATIWNGGHVEQAPKEEGSLLIGERKLTLPVSLQASLAVVPAKAEQATDEVVIQAKSRVKMTVRIGDLEVTAGGLAVENGKVGQSIRVENLDSKRVVTGVVTGPGAVEIDLGESK